MNGSTGAQGYGKARLDGRALRIVPQRPSGSLPRAARRLVRGRLQVGGNRPPAIGRLYGRLETALARDRGSSDRALERSSANFL